jgi:hypothetical protein
VSWFPAARETGAGLVRGTDLSVALVEIGCNWRSVEILKKSKDLVSPDASAFATAGPICEKPTSILIRYAELVEIELPEMRDWVIGRARGKFKMFNRFEYENLPWRVHKEFIGVNFRFKDTSDALLFKLFWS